MKQAIKICFVLSLLNAALVFLPAISSAEPTLQYSWNMDVNPGWSAELMWGWGQPTGGGGDEWGEPDPTSGYTGTNVYGYNLYGDYQNDLPEKNLTSSAIDCSGLSQITLKFRRWMSVEEGLWDHAYIRVSNDGSAWTTVWENPEDAEIAEISWSLQVLDISGIADGQPTVYLRWTMGPTDDMYQYCGWNIDDVEIWAVSDVPPVLPPTATTGLTTSVSSNSATLNGTVNPNGASTAVVFQYGLSTSYGSTATAAQSPLTGTSAQAVSAGITGLTQGTTYHYRVTATNSAGTTYGSDRTLTTNKAPTATTGTATSVSSNSATLNGTVNPNGTSTTVVFEYGLSTGYGSTATAAQSPLTGTISQAVNAGITGLTQGTTYHYRVAATNSEGTTYGSDRTLTTNKAPTATTGTATSVSSNSATLNGTVNPNGTSTTVVFEYGLSTGYGSTATAAQSPLTGTISQAVNAGITGLTQGTTYHYRIAATNSEGTTYGSDRTFTTLKLCPECSGSRVVLENVTFPSGKECECIATISITAGTGVTVENGATVTFQAPTVKLLPGFHAENGAVVRIKQQPTATTGSATSVTSTSATLNGTVNPNGASTTVVFQYGLSTSYGNAATAAQSPLTGTSAQAVSAGITGLTQGTTYHYRVVATNSAGTGSGSDRTFTTQEPCPECSGSRVVLENVTFPSGRECECIASISITIGTGVTVENNATVTFKAPTVKLRPGFHAKKGALVRIKQ